MGETRKALAGRVRLLGLAAVLLALFVASPIIALGTVLRPAQASPGHIGSPILEAVTDPDGDGLIDAIVLTVPFVINDTGTWYFGGRIELGTEWAAGNSTEAMYLGPGTHPIDLSMPMWYLRRFRTDGPYIVSLYMFQEDTRFTATANHTTGPYAWSSLEFLVEFMVPIAERPIDADGDGLYNYLEVSGRLNASFPERARIEGRLYSEAGTVPFAYLFHEVRLVADSQSFAYRFSGDAIRASNVDGVYRLELEILDFGNYSPREKTTLLTRGYAASQFFHQPITITGSPSDRPIDFDGNGLFDVLRIEVPVEVRLAGVYRVFASLEYGPMSVYIYGVTANTLASGATRAHVDIDGFEIRKTSNSFSYSVRLGIVEDVSPYFVETSGTTAVLHSHEFDNPYGDIANLTVAPLDEDADGEFEALRVEATIRVKRAASFGGIFAIVTDPANPYWDENFFVRGTPGFVTVEHTFPGWRLRAMGWNGTYRVHMMLYAGGFGIHSSSIERNFTYDEFEPALRLVGPLSLERLDSDGDGLWNQLVVHMPLRVEAAGSYSFLVTARDQGRGGTGAWRSRYLDSGDLDLAIGLSGIALSGLTGPTLNVTFSASLAAELGSTVTVLDLRHAEPFDPSRFQTAPRKTVAFHITAPERINYASLALRNHSNAFWLSLTADANGQVTATLPDLQYDLLVAAYPGRYSRLYGQVSALPYPLPDVVSTYLDRPEHVVRDRKVMLTDWSNGSAVTSFTFGPYGYFRWFADGDIKPDGFVSAEEILNLARLSSGYLDLAPALWIDDLQVQTVPTGLPVPFGEGPVLAAEGPGFTQEYSLSTPSHTTSAHKIRVNVTRESDQIRSTVTLRVPPRWKVVSVDAPHGVVVTQPGPREVSIDVIIPRYPAYSVNLTVVPDSSSLAGSIVGRVVDPEGHPIAGAFALLTLRDVFVTHREADASGAFVFEGLSPDSYRLHVTASGFVSTAVPANVAANAPTDLGEIVLKREVVESLVGPERMVMPAASGIAIGIAAVIALVLYLRRRSKDV